MKLKTLFALTLSVFTVAITGCVSTPTGSEPSLTFNSGDRIAKYQRPVEQLAEATKTVLTRNGKLILYNVVNNTFKARINERDVWVTISKVDAKTTQVEVQARTSVGGDIDLAAEIDKQIALQLTTYPTP
jgi:hypothetical protein